MRDRAATGSGLLLVLAALAGCSPGRTTIATPLPDVRKVSTAASVAPPSSASSAAPPPARPQLDPDGDDDPVPLTPGAIPAHGHFERVGAPPLALQRICDLTAFGDALYAAHANQPLGTDGATISRYRPSDEKHPFSIAFDWNRPGEPTHGGGAGQGFLRVHAIGGRLFVPDADPPYNGFGISEPGTEGFVYLSTPDGRFASARMPGHRPPGPPDADGRAGAAVLPRAYHVIDAIRFRGRYYAATGSVPPTERAWRGASPGALHVARPDLGRWEYEVDYPYPWQDGVWRLTYMIRFHERLYAGIQDYDGREPNDYVYCDPPADAARIERRDVHAVRATAHGAAETLRWYVDPVDGALYWIAWSRDGVHLRRTRDGDSWSEMTMPDDAGAPTDVVRFRDGLVVLTERALVRLGETATIVARVDGKKSPFEATDYFCAAPLAVFEGELYAGGQRGGALYKLVAEP